MAMITYDNPISNDVVNQSLENNPALQASPNVLASVQSLLFPPGSTTVVSGNVNLATGVVTAPSTTGLQSIVLDTRQLPSGSNVVITSETPWFALNAMTTKYYSFAGGNVNITMTGVLGDPVILSGDGNDNYQLGGGDSEITILGGGGNDTLVTGSADDSISGDAGNDSIVAGAGDDSIQAGQGFDTIDGSSGWDVVQLTNTPSSYGAPVVVGSTVTFDHIAPGGSDFGVTLQNVEFVGGLQTEGKIANADGTSYLGGQQNSWVIVDNTNDLLVARLYQALLNRSADSAGIDYWETQIDNGYSVTTLANAFLVSDEFQSQWGQLSNSAYVDLVFRNAYGRDASQSEEAYWTNLLNSGSMSKAQVAVTIVGTTEASQTIDNVVLVG